MSKLSFCNYICLVPDALDIYILPAVIFVKRKILFPFYMLLSLVFHWMNSMLHSTISPQRLDYSQ